MNRFDDRTVAITAAGRDFGRTLALAFAERGAEVFLSARTLAAVSRTREEILNRVPDARLHVFACDITDPDSVRDFADGVASRTGALDILVNNGARYLGGSEPTSASDADIAETVASAATGTILVTKAFLPLLRRSAGADIVTLVSTCGEHGHTCDAVHDAFHAAKAGQAAFTDNLSRRLRPEGIRVISLYPPDFRNLDPFTAEWDDTPRGTGDTLTSRSVLETVLFAVGQTRDCFVRAIHFEENMPGRAVY